MTYVVIWRCRENKINLKPLKGGAIEGSGLPPNIMARETLNLSPNELMV